MSRTFVLESFDAPTGTEMAAAAAHSRDAEADRLSTFERGYKAGWDDSVAAQSEERRAISADFAANLADLSFTYHEARGHVMRQLEDLVTETFSRVLPACAKMALPRVVWEHVERLAAEVSGTPVTVLVAPGAGALLDGLLPAEPGFPISVVEEPTLADGQVFIRSQQGELAVDQATALADIETSVRAFFTAHDQDEEGMKAHG